MGFFTNVELYVRGEELARLPLGMRMAWNACCLERVIGLLSPYFQETFLQRNVVALVWRTALGESVAESDRRDLISRLLTLGTEGTAESEGYGNHSVMAGGYALEEIGDNSGECASRSVDCAGSLFRNRQLWIQGVAVDRCIPDDYCERLEIPYFEMTRKAFELAQGYTGTIRGSMFDEVKLDLSFSPLDVEVIRQCQRKPPIEEQKFLLGHRLDSQLNGM